MPASAGAQLVDPTVQRARDEGLRGEERPRQRVQLQERDSDGARLLPKVPGTVRSDRWRVEGGRGRHRGQSRGNVAARGLPLPDPHPPCQASAVTSIKRNRRVSGELYLDEDDMVPSA